MDRPTVAYITSNDSDVSLTRSQLEGVDHVFVRHLVSSEGEAIEAVRGASVVIDEAVPLTRAVIESMDGVAGIVSLGHGFNHIDDGAATEAGIMVANCAGYCADEVANHTIMFVLACSKRLIPLDRQVRAGGWEPSTPWRLHPMPAVRGQTMGLIGFGNIGRPTARKAAAFGMHVAVYDPYLPPWVAAEYDVEQVGSMEELAAGADYVSMHAPLNDETQGLAGEALFAAMKPTAHFINTCRGPTHDEAALVRALREGRIAGAALDVFEVEPTPADNPLLTMDNVIVTPHSAGTSDHSNEAGRLRLGQEAARILSGMYPMSLANPGVVRRIPARGPATAQWRGRPGPAERRGT